MSAIALNGGHVSRALDFYNKEGKYFIIGGNTPWRYEPTPDESNIEVFKLVDVIGLKKVDDIRLVVPDDNGTIVSRDQKWRIVTSQVLTRVGARGVVAGDTEIYLETISDLKKGDKVRIDNLYEGTIIEEVDTNIIKLDTPAPTDISAGSVVEGGAMIEGAKYVYVQCYLEYDLFPLATYRQIGLCTGVVPKSGYEDILLDASYSTDSQNQYESLGVLEILDNRSPIPRDRNMRELISMIIEF